MNYSKDFKVRYRKKGRNNMGMDYVGMEVEVIEVSEIEKLNLKSFKKLRDEVEKLDQLDEYDIFRHFTMGELYSDFYTEEQINNLCELYVEFQNEFKRKTGIIIYINYHDSMEYGSLYDEVDGLFFELNHVDVYEMKPEAKLLYERLGFTRSNYVYYG